MSRKCIIFGAGEPVKIPLEILEDSYVIAADGGFESLKKQGITPNIIIGDFDSLENIPSGIAVIRHSAEKDDTDMELAAQYAIESGFDEIFIFGALGGRTDHTIANIQLLTALSKQGIKSTIIGEDEFFFAVTNGTLDINGSLGSLVSVFCMGDRAIGVSLAGMKYPLTDAVLTCDKPLGVSNKLIFNMGTVTVKNGTLLVIVNKG